MNKEIAASTDKKTPRSPFGVPVSVGQIDWNKNKKATFSASNSSRKITVAQNLRKRG